MKTFNVGYIIAYMIIVECSINQFQMSPFIVIIVTIKGDIWWG